MTPNRTKLIDEQLTRMAAHLAARRSAILAAWRQAVDADPELTTASSLPRTQFNDHVPELLDAFEGLLRAWPEATRKADDDQQKEDAAGHGLQRWQQGYHLREVTREWGHLHLCLLDELEAFASASAYAGTESMAIAQRALVEFCNQGVGESTLRYFQLQQTEAVGHVRDLGETLEEVRRLESQRAELLRQAAHDLRGNLGVVSNATSGLTLDGLPEKPREDFLRRCLLLSHRNGGVGVKMHQFLLAGKQVFKLKKFLGDLLMMVELEANVYQSLRISICNRRQR